jgi:hypothetical protein
MIDRETLPNRKFVLCSRQFHLSGRSELRSEHRTLRSALQKALHLSEEKERYAQVSHYTGRMLLDSQSVGSLRFNESMQQGLYIVVRKGSDNPEHTYCTNLLEALDQALEWHRLPHTFQTSVFNSERKLVIGSTLTELLYQAIQKSRGVYLDELFTAHRLLRCPSWGGL